MEARLSAARDGLRGRIGRWDMHDLGRKVLQLSQDGLRRRAQLDDEGKDETGFLSPLVDAIADGKTPAERLLDMYHGDWEGDLSHVFETHQY